MHPFKYFRRLSLRAKLTLLTVVASGAAILVACGGFTAYDLFAVRRAMLEAIDTQAAIVAGNSTAALTFADANDAASILSSLKNDPHVEMAAVFSADGRELATYFRDPQLGKYLPQKPGVDGARFATGFLDTNRAVMLDGQRVGTVYLRCGLEQLQTRIRHYCLIIFFLMSLALATSVFLIARAQPYVTGPILHLAQTARELTASRNYSLRAKKTADDEVGMLTDCFNEMLHEMEQRDAQLAGHRDQLEAEVQRRTGELVQVNHQLLEEKDRAESASRAKSAFLANMSHEIRTPMTAIVGYSDVMLEPGQTLSDRQDCLQVIRRNGKHLLELINDILDLSKIEAGKMQVEPISTNLPEILSDLISLMRPRASAKGLHFELEVIGEVPQRIITDPLRLRQILMNLIANAIKFTEEGGVYLRVQLDQFIQPAVMQFGIVDTGIGIAPGQMPRLFQSFSQADESMTRRFGGTGLGLAISEKLARLLGGKISVESIERKGSVFTLSIDPGPLAGVEMIKGLTEAILPPPSNAASRPVVRIGGRILLVEDGPDNQRLISMHLRKGGANVELAGNGRIGVEKVMAAVHERQPYDLIVMDMQMPELDGYGATSLLRQRGVDTPIIALTAHAMAEDRAKCISAGCTDYLTKPIDKRLLLETVGKYLALPAAGLAARVTPAGGASPAFKADGSGEGTSGEMRGLREWPLTPTLFPEYGGKGSGEDHPNRASQPPCAPAPALTHPGLLTPPKILRSSMADDPDVREILGEFVGDLPGYVATMQSLLTDENLEELRRMIHRIKGAGGGYGFDSVTRLADDVERRIKTSALQEIARDVDDLVQLLRSVEGYKPELEKAVPK